ncbi:probable E3 ubiquitin-protein ligase HECTD2 [Eurytemora carolleeae]|uniref:probable E3 ubiquitin-protein ligase HECTD2 n=1 Tax=Eurytemora carolleeae TaxID=1294199 RepID=UPI000C78CAEF|nr:probable E3 ubiquitin-protein ligase HECTD2 [Eurytemora carolleeae]|eukprot:XP_023332612.1 probable E3 ubiquitin-protein ligase HECTD2 [Eurytemora affinis]
MDNIRGMSAGVQKTMLKSIITSLLDRSKPLYGKDNVRALLILLQNPIFSAQSTYTVFSHILQNITSLHNGDHQLLVHWFRNLEPHRLASIVRNLLQLITIRQFPPADKSLPPLAKSKWWIPTATKVHTLNVIKHYGFSLYIIYIYIPGQFSYCQYPFILSIVAKRHILTKDSEQQMILTNISPGVPVRRDHLVTDSLKEISAKQKDLKKKLKVSFSGEPGLDMGGLTKEWFQLLIKQIFDAEYGMFVYHTHSSILFREYNLIGVLMGLAVYNSIILDLHFPGICYRKLLTPPVVPPELTTDELQFGFQKLASTTMCSWGVNSVVDYYNRAGRAVYACAMDLSKVEILVCGSPTMDLTELKKVVVYDGYKPTDQTIIFFWEVLLNYSESLQKKFLLFTTGSDRVPVGGMGEMSFKISKLKDKLSYLPEAHTCFNQLVLPDYQDKDCLQEKLTIAISNAEGFGLE